MDKKKTWGRADLIVKVCLGTAFLALIVFMYYLIFLAFRDHYREENWCIKEGYDSIGTNNTCIKSHLDCKENVAGVTSCTNTLEYHRIPIKQ